MVHAVVIDDEKPAVENLVHALSTVASDIEVTTCLYSVRESITYLSRQPDVDLIFSDIRLNDGLSFDIFRQTGIRTPVIFLARQAEFMPDVFSCNGIAYVEKPWNLHRLQQSVSKYKALRKHFDAADNRYRYLRRLQDPERPRLLVRSGRDTIALRHSDIVLFYVDNRSIYALDRSNATYRIRQGMGELERALSPQHFFRANRQYILNIDYVHAYSTFEKVKLLVRLTLPHIHHEIIVSQELAPHFRSWLRQA